MNAFTRIVKWLIGRTIFVSLLYFGVVLDWEGPRNMMIFLCWTLFLISPLSFMTASQKSIAKSPRFPLPVNFTYPLSLAFAGTMVWHGFWVTSIVYMLGVTFIAIATEAAHATTPKAETP